MAGRGGTASLAMCRAGQGAGLDRIAAGLGRSKLNLPRLPIVYVPAEVDAEEVAEVKHYHLRRCLQGRRKAMQKASPPFRIRACFHHYCIFAT